MATEQPDPDDHFSFSRRERITNEACDWCDSHERYLDPFNVVTALNALGYLRTQPKVDSDDD